MKRAIINMTMLMAVTVCSTDGVEALAETGGTPSDFEIQYTMPVRQTFSRQQI